MKLVKVVIYGPKNKRMNEFGCTYYVATTINNIRDKNAQDVLITKCFKVFEKYYHKCKDNPDFEYPFTLGGSYIEDKYDYLKYYERNITDLGIPLCKIEEITTQKGNLLLHGVTEDVKNFSWDSRHMLNDIKDNAVQLRKECESILEILG